MDDAFERLVNKNQKSDMGQFFTPRYVIDMCVKMLNPKPDETMIDTAAGSCGFPMHTIFHVWQQMNPGAFNLFTTRNRTEEELDYVRNNVFGIDFSEKSVRVGRMLNIIAGDGHTNVIYLNTLDYYNWRKNFLNVEKWQNKYYEGFNKLANLSMAASSSRDKAKYRAFKFDVLMANPPFTGRLDNVEQLKEYDLGHKYKQNKKQNIFEKENVLKRTVTRDILFIERNLNFLKPGGRMAVVLPQGVFNNSTAQYIREYILQKCRLLAVIGLHPNTFKNGKEGTGTKTSVLVVQKWTSEEDKKRGFDNICPKPEPNKDGVIDYPIFFATMQESSKDNSGNKIYVTENYVTWRKYKYNTKNHFFRKADNQEVTESEYNSAKKKTDYRKKISTDIEIEEQCTADGSVDFIKDLFVEKYGSLNSHRNWILKNVGFTLKNKKSDADGHYKKDISMDEFLSLPKDDRTLYKEVPILGENKNDVISWDEYNALDKDEQKYYLISEDVTERTERVKDTHGHIFVKHDLFNHDPKLANPNPNNIYSKDGIAEAFIEFAKKEGLSFFQ